MCLSAGTATAQLAGNLVGMHFVERHGRRPLTLWSLGGVCGALALLGVAFHPGTQSTELAFIAMVAYLFVFGIGLAPMPWTVNAEIYPLHTRSTCMAVATGVNWISNFVVSLTFLDLATALSTDRGDAEHHPDGVFWLYAGVGLLCGGWLYGNMPETKGVSLEHMGKLFSRGSQRDEYQRISGQSSR